MVHAVLGVLRLVVLGVTSVSAPVVGTISGTAYTYRGGQHHYLYRVIVLLDLGHLVILE